MHTFENIIKRFIEDYSFRLEKTTIENYVRSLRQLLSFCEKPYNEIVTRDIRNWLIHLEETGYKISSIKSKMFGLRLFYQYCLEEELMNHNPAKAVPLPSDEDKLPQYLTHEQLAQLRRLSEKSLKERAVVEVLYTTGVRLRELAKMKLEDIHWTERMIRIPKGKAKKERIVLFTKECSVHLSAYLQKRSDDLPYVFLNRYEKGPIVPRSIQYWFESYREKMGIFLSPHTLRHTFAAHLAMKGMTLACLQVLLGHGHPRHTHLYARLHQHAQKQMYDQWM